MSKLLLALLLQFLYIYLMNLPINYAFMTYFIMILDLVEVISIIVLAVIVWRVWVFFSPMKHLISLLGSYINANERLGKSNTKYKQLIKEMEKEIVQVRKKFKS